MDGGLNTAQRQAVEIGDGPVLVVAGPGTGKTRTLTTRIVHLLEKKVKSEQILALTFTKKAAEEMQSRVATMVSGTTPYITTFHGLCYELLGDDTPFVTDTKRLAIVRSLSRPQDLKGVSTRELGLFISRAKNSPKGTGDPAIAKLVQAYDQALGGLGLRDYDDLLLRAYEQLKANATTRKVVQARYHHILVDEFQDTNLLQYEILKLLRGNSNLFVIGDPSQSIYGFRGASGGIFEQFKTGFPNTTEITLDVNYRSAPEIVRLSNAIFPNQKPLHSAQEHHGQVRAVQVLNEYGEANWVLSEIQRAIGGGDFLRAVSDDERAKHRRLSDFAVLYRSRSAAIAFQKMIDDSGLPYQVVGDGSPYEKSQVQAIISLMRAYVADEDEQVRDIVVDTHMRQALELLKKEGYLAPTAFAERAIALLGFESNRDLSQLIATLVRFEDVSSAVRHFDDIAANGFYDPQADAITLLTIHAAKGLEFSCVFLLGAEEGVLPSKRGELDEEKRLFYVAITRAKECLEITHAKKRGGEPAKITRFITELPAGILECTADPDMAAQTRRLVKRQAKRSQQSLF